jgi:uncharacterized protein YqjF (DUF2071 family)
MLNYVVDPAVLLPLVPAGTELDFWRDRACVSVVGFLFLNTRVRGFAIPFHRNFEEVNLRFYVRRRGPEGWRRGVVFIRELVPRVAIALIARMVYNENYSAVPMSHRIEKAAGGHGKINSASYGWRCHRTENRATVSVQGDPQPLAGGSEAEFIAEHYWGYTAQRDGSTIEYRVEHPPWRIWTATKAELNCDVAGCYGESFGQFLGQPPASAFLTEGSEVSVYEGVRL